MNLTKNIKIRILAFMMAFWLAFSVTYNDYQEVEALEWAIPVIGFDTAIKFLLGLLGVSLTSKALHDNVDWGQVRQNCIDYQISSGNDAVAVGEWWEDVIHGTLDQASDCWTSFKSWVVTFVNNQSSSVSFDTYTSFSKFLELVNSNYTVSNSFNQTITGCLCFINPTTNLPMIYYFTDAYNITIFQSSDGLYRFKNADSINMTYYSLGSVSNNVISSSSFQGHTLNSTTSLAIGRNIAVLYFLGVFANESALSMIDLADDSLNDGIFDSANDKIQDTDLTTDNATTDAIPGALPLPWDNVSDTAEGVADAIDALQEAVAEGVLSLEDYWQRVQDLVGALAIDTTTDEVLPNEENPDTGENETLQDKVQENTSNGTFTLGGMEKVFPFCIPWDIYAFVTLLVAQPVAPKINYPFYNPVTKQNINIEIDFADWETVVVLFRYILDFLLIIGLLLLARSLSGAGGYD